MIAAWNKLKESGLVVKHNFINTYIYVFGMAFEFALMIGLILGANYYRRKKYAELERLDQMLSEWSTEEEND